MTSYNISLAFTNIISSKRIHYIAKRGKPIFKLLPCAKFIKRKPYEIILRQIFQWEITEIRFCIIPKEDLDEGIETLKTIAEMAIKTNLPLIAVYALRYTIRLNTIHSIELSKSQEYIGKFKDLLNSEPIYQYLINEEIGKQLFYAGNKEESSKILTKVIDTELPEHYIEGLELYSIYPQLIGDKEPTKAHGYLLKGLQKAISDPRIIILDKIKIYGEAGISYWLSGDNKEALYHLEKGFELLLDNFDNSPEHQAAVIRFAHVANYLKGIVMDGTPPTKSGDGGIYAIPVRGSFYFTIDKLLEGGYYFDERKFIGATLFEGIFEFYEDYDTAKKWGLRAIEISMQLTDPKYTAVLLVNINYLIIDRKFQKAVNLYLYIEQFLRKLNDSEKAKEDPSLRKALDDSKAWERNEPYYFQYIVLPPVFTIAEDILSGKIQQLDLPIIISELFSHLSIDLKDRQTLDFINKLYVKILIDKNSTEEINALLDSYQGNYKSQVYTVGYILASINATPHDAARMHFSLMPSIEEAFNNKFTAFYRFCIVPFFISFWKKKFEERKADFMYADHWESTSVPYFSNASLSNKLKFLFQSLGHHLNVPLTSKLTDWISAK